MWYKILNRWKTGGTSCRQSEIVAATKLLHTTKLYQNLILLARKNQPIFHISRIHTNVMLELPEVSRLGEGQICIPLGAKEIAVLTDNDSFQSK